MTRLRTLLVTVRDPLEPPVQALARAASLARHSGARIELFHAVTGFAPGEATRRHSGRGPARSLLASVTETRRTQLEGIARHRVLRDLETSCHASWDSPAHEAIVRRARTVEADLVVAECHAHHVGSRWLLTNTDWELIRLCPIPLLLAKSARAYDRPRIVVALDPQHAHDKPGHLDRSLLEAARLLARELDGEVHAAHAYMPLATTVPAAMPMPVPTWVPDDATEVHRQRISDAFDRVASLGRIPRARRHLLPGPTASELEALTRRLRAQILVMGAVSRSGIKRLFIGSTAERLLDHVPCDVLVVKPHGFRSPVPVRRRSA